MGIYNSFFTLLVLLSVSTLECVSVSQAPDPPSMLSAIYNSTSKKIDIYWVPPTPLPTGYKITVSTGQDSKLPPEHVNDGAANMTSIDSLSRTKTYTISMISVNGNTQSTTVGPVLAAAGPGLAYRGKALPNHHVLSPSDIGSNDTAVYCIVNDSECCGSPPDNRNGRGDWYYPSNIMLDSQGSLYATWTYGATIMNSKGDNLENSSGLFRCDIMDHLNSLQTFYLGVYPENQGLPVISNSIGFHLVSSDPLVFTLECVSSGGPATTVSWMRDGATVSEGDGHIVSQRVVDMQTAKYRNTLTVNENEPGDYQCTVANVRGNDSQILTIEAASVPTGIIARQDGSTITVSWSPPSGGPSPSGYIIYYQAANDEGSVVINSTQHSVNITVQKDLAYSIRMLTLSKHLPSVKTSSSPALRMDVYLQLNDKVLANHSLVNEADIGDSESTGLRCVTARIDCCSGGDGEGSDENITDWFHISKISIYGMIRSRSGEGGPLGFVNIFHRSDDDVVADKGIYHCIIPAPDPAPNTHVQTLYVGIYPHGSGQLNISEHILFTLQSATTAKQPLFSMTCVSVGGPVTSLTWTRNGIPVTVDSDHSSLRRVVNRTTAKYSNELTVYGREPGVYECSVSNAKSNDSRALTVQEAQMPVNLSAEAINSTAVDISWNAPASAVSVIAFEIHYNCCQNGSTHAVAISDSSATSYTLSNLEPGFTFSLQIIALSKHLPSCISGPVFVTTSSEVPSGTPQEFAADPQVYGITFFWKPPLPLDRNGVIISYTVLCSYTSGSGNISVQFSEAGSGVVGGLSPFTIYSCSIFATNDAGDGPSAYINVTTLEAPPSSVLVAVWSPVMNTVVDIAWIGPPTPNGVILGYRIMLEEYEGDLIYATDNISADITAVQISDLALEAGVPYTVTIVARNSAGYGNKTSITNFIRELAPSAPTEVLTDRISGSHMLISWDKLTLKSARGIVQQYIVHYTAADSNTAIRQTVKVEVPGSDSSVLVSGLQQTLAYVVAVSAVTGAGEGPSSLHTVAAAPLPVCDCPSDSSCNVGVMVAIVGGPVAAVVLITFIIIIIITYLIWRWHTHQTSHSEESNCEPETCVPGDIMLDKTKSQSEDDDQSEDVDDQYQHVYSTMEGFHRQETELEQVDSFTVVTALNPMYGEGLDEMKKNYAVEEVVYETLH